MAINRTAMIDYMDGRIAATTDAKHRAQLEVVRAHMVGEIAEDIDALLATLSPVRVQYRTWGAPESMSPASHDDVRAFYAERKALGQLYFQFDIDRLSVADGVVITDGVMNTLVPGALAGYFGAPDPDPAAVYRATTRMLISWPFDETGLLLGEETYAVPLGIVALPPDEVPADFGMAVGGQPGA